MFAPESPTGAGVDAPVDAALEVAVAAAVAAFIAEPFYRHLFGHVGRDSARYRRLLADYFRYSFAEARRLGHLELAPAGSGVAAWLRPMPDTDEAAAATAKQYFLGSYLGPEVLAAYTRLVSSMHRHVPAGAPLTGWYLSILAVAPDAQGRGLGSALLEPTLAGLDASGQSAWLETTTWRNVRFHERHRFVTRRIYTDPVAGTTYWVMVREPPGSTP